MLRSSNILTKDTLVLAILACLAILWIVHAHHYYSLLGYYFNNFDYFNDLKVMVLTFVLETWYLISLILLTYVLIKLANFIKDK